MVRAVSSDVVAHQKQIVCRRAGHSPFGV